MDEEKIKQENIMLVEKTKKMIEEMTMTPVQKEKLRNPKYDTIPNSPSRKSNALSYDKNLINVALIDSQTDLKLTVRNMANKISEMSVYIQSLEKENKQKDDIITSLNQKLYSNNEKISNLNKRIIEERHEDVVVENSKLKRKIMALEKSLNENIFMYEEIIKEYKEKLKNITNDHKEKTTRLDRLCNDKQSLVSDNEQMKKTIEDHSKTIKNYSYTIQEKETKERQLCIRVEELENHIKVLLSIINNLKQKEQNEYSKKKQLLNHIHLFFNNK